MVHMCYKILLTQTDLLATNFKMPSPHYQARHKNISLTNIWADDECTQRFMNIAMIHADGPKLTRMLANLLSNALKFTPEEGEVKVLSSLICMDVGRNEKYTLKVSVIDTGVGMSKVFSQKTLY